MLVYGKSTLLRGPVELVEAPAKLVMETKMFKNTLLVGDRFITAADGTIDRAISTSLYKNVARIAQRTYSNKIQPITMAITNIVKTLMQDYQSVVISADALVERYLPGKPGTDLELVKGVTGLLGKIGRRGSTDIIHIADKIALKYSGTAAMRNFAVGKYQSNLAPLTAQLVYQYELLFSTALPTDTATPALEIKATSSPKVDSSLMQDSSAPLKTVPANKARKGNMLFTEKAMEGPADTHIVPATACAPEMKGAFSEATNDLPSTSTAEEVHDDTYIDPDASLYYLNM